MQPDTRASPVLTALNRLFLNAGGRASSSSSLLAFIPTRRMQTMTNNIFYKYPLLLFT